MTNPEGAEIQSSATPVLEYPPGEVPRGTWRAGTLVYTSAGLVVLFCWLLWGDFAWSMKDRAAGPIVTVLLKKFQATDFLLAMLTVSMPAAVNIFLAPIISYRSDRHRGRWGRRIPYLIAITPISALAMLGVAFSPKLGLAAHASLSSLHFSENTFVLFFCGAFWTIFEIASLSANGVFGGLINDVVPRPLLGRFYGLFRALSLIAGIIFNFLLFAKARQHYIWVFLGVSILYGVGFLMMCLKVKEGDYPPPPPAQQRKTIAHGFVSASRIFFKECFSNQYYLWIFLGWNFANLAFVPVNGFQIPYYASVNMSDQAYGSVVALTYAISLGLSYFLGALCDRVHPLRVSILTLLLYAVGSAWGGMFATTARTFAIALVTHGVLSGAFYTASASLGQKLYPHARFAQFAAAATMIMAVSQIILGPALGRFLDWTHHTYRYTFVIGSVLCLLGAGCLMVVLQKYNRLGGDEGYVAPE